MRRLVMGFLALVILIVFARGGEAAELGGKLSTQFTLTRKENWVSKLDSSLVLDYRHREWEYRVDGSVELKGKLAQGDLSGDVDLTRLSINLYGSPWVLSLGKQPLTFGVGQSWPGKKSLLNIYYENFWGASLRLPTAPLEYWTATAGRLAGKDIYSLRKQGYYNGLRWSLLAARQEKEFMIGLDGKVDIGIELYGELLYNFKPSAATQLLVGSDYHFGPFLLATEFRRDALLPSFLGQNYLWQMISYPIDDFTSAFVTVDVNTTDKSRLWAFGAETILFNGINLAIGAMYPRGDQGTYYQTVIPGPSYSLSVSYSF